MDTEDERSPLLDREVVWSIPNVVRERARLVLPDNRRARIERQTAVVREARARVGVGVRRRQQAEDERLEIRDDLARRGCCDRRSSQPARMGGDAADRHRLRARAGRARRRAVGRRVAVRLLALPARDVLAQRAGRCLTDHAARRSWSSGWRRARRIAGKASVRASRAAKVAADGRCERIRSSGAAPTGSEPRRLLRHGPARLS